MGFFKGRRPVTQIATGLILAVLLSLVLERSTAAAECTAGTAGLHALMGGHGAEATTSGPHGRSNCLHDLPARPELTSRPDLPARTFNGNVYHAQSAARPENEDTPSIATAPMITHWSMASALSAASVATEHSRDTEDETMVAHSLNELHWADSYDWIHNPPAWLKEAKNYRRQGMPIIHLMESKQTLVAIGVSNHGKPGLYFTRRLPF